MQIRDEQARLAARTEGARRVALGLGPDEDTWEIDEGALAECPVWGSYKRGKSWMAEISIDPASPGGLGRSFFAEAKGPWYYLVGQDGSLLKPGMALEFGADFYSGPGRPSRTRWCGYVVRVVAAIKGQSAYVVLDECANGPAAVKAGKAHVTAMVDAQS